MSDSENDKSKLTDAIPDPQVVRERLGETLREAGLLRQLLRVAEKAHRAKLVRQGRPKAVGHA